MSVVFGAPMTEASVIRQTAPFDVGCAGKAPPCPADSPRAEMGRIEGSIVPSACVLYGPPFVIPCFANVSSSTGAIVELSSPSTIVVGARVRGVGPIDRNGGFAPRACLGFVTSDGRGAFEYGCRLLSRDRDVIIVSRFEDSIWTSGKYVAFVYLTGLASEADVKAIKFRVEPA